MNSCGGGRQREQQRLDDQCHPRHRHRQLDRAETCEKIHTTMLLATAAAAAPTSPKKETSGAPASTTNDQAGDLRVQNSFLSADHDEGAARMSRQEHDRDAPDEYLQRGRGDAKPSTEDERQDKLSGKHQAERRPDAAPRRHPE